MGKSKPLSISNMQMNMFYIPAIFLFSVFVIYPFIKGIFFSLTDWNGYSQTYHMVGFENYKRLFVDPNFYTALKNTLIYGIGSTVLQNVMGLALALFLNQKIIGKSVIRAIIYLPVIISPLIMGYIMYFFVSYERGALNDIVMLFCNNKIDWMGDGNRAVIIMTLVNSFQFVGVAMVIYLAGLQNIPQMYYEAAWVDGITKFEELRYITIPLLQPAFKSAIIINLIGGLKLFDIIMALTAGGPGYASHSLSTMVNRTYFGSENAGYAAAIGMASFLLIMLLSTITTRLLSKKEVI